MKKESSEIDQQHNTSNKKKVLIVGASGQLGQCIENIQKEYHTLEIFLTSSRELNITEKQDILAFFQDNFFDYVINCAAYTNVEQAEKESEQAFLVNAQGTKNLAEACKEQDSTLIHISTDYVFDGQKKSPYTETDIPNPINEYGKSKLKGEQYIQNILDTYFIIRTSWLYSRFGHNFYKTILKKSETEKELTITTEEIGTPTNAHDLAKFILNLIKGDIRKYGVYHYSNYGEATWYDFAEEILRVSQKLDSILLKKTDNYPTFAKRPKYSVLSKTKVENIAKEDIPTWKASLQKIVI